MLTEKQKDLLDSLMDALVNGNTVSVHFNYGQNDFSAEEVYLLIGELCKGRNW